MKSISLLAARYCDFLCVKAYTIVVVCALVQNVMQYEIVCMEYRVMNGDECVYLYPRKGLK